jgi:hypothetical protein
VKAQVSGLDLVLHIRLASSDLLNAMRVHVVADDTVAHLGGAHGQRQPHVALTSDNNMHDSSYYNSSA